MSGPCIAFSTHRNHAEFFATEKDAKRCADLASVVIPVAVAKEANDMLEALRQLQLEASLYVGYGFDMANESANLTAACERARAILARINA